MNQRFRITGDIDAQDVSAALNAPREAVYCERCQKVHPARPAGEFDRMIREKSQELARAIDAEALEAMQL